MLQIRLGRVGLVGAIGGRVVANLIVLRSIGLADLIEDIGLYAIVEDMRNLPGRVFSRFKKDAPSPAE